MTYGFHRSGRGIAADLTEQEREILLGLLQQTVLLLQDAAGSASSADAPDDDSFEAMMRRAGFEGGESDDAAPAPAQEFADPAVRRLLPDGHHDDPEMAEEFRRLTGTSVRDRKLGHLRTAVQVVADAEKGRLRLTEEEATSLLISMTDVRLVLAERLGLGTDEAAAALSDEIATMDQDEPRFALALGYEFLTWLQETLAVALTR